MAWWADLIYWGSNGPSNRQMLPGDGTVANGSILFRMQGRDEGTSDGVNHEFNLAITDDPGFRPREGATDDVVELLSFLSVLGRLSPGDAERVARRAKQAVVGAGVATAGHGGVSRVP